MILKSRCESSVTRNHQIRVNEKVMRGFNRLDGKITKKVDGIDIVIIVDLIVLVVGQSDWSAGLQVYNHCNSICLY